MQSRENQSSLLFLADDVWERLFGKELCKSNGIAWGEKDIAECYMVMGGIYVSGMWNKSNIRLEFLEYLLKTIHGEVRKKMVVHRLIWSLIGLTTVLTS